MDLEGFPSRLRGEIYLLILGFLEGSPCERSAEELKRDLVRNGLVPPRLDWRGCPHARSMEDFRQEYASRGPNPFLSLLQKLSVGDASSDSALDRIPSLFLRAQKGKRSLKTPSLLSHLRSRQLGLPSSQERLLSHVIPGLKCLRKTLGHLSSVFCVLLDRTGTLVFTGADDLLVKCWNLRNGRLIYTFRGASSEISDMDVSHDNRLLAVGSCDKIVRVWCLYSAAPIAVLAKQMGLITTVSFCPYQGAQDGDRHFLSFTSGEGAVSFWGYSYNAQGKAVFEEGSTKYLEKIRPGGAQMICGSFSPGGIFYCVGSVDTHVRVYKMDTPEGPQRILEDNAHSDRVDSIQWCHGSGLRFVSGSKDGTARIWSYERLKWTSIVLKMAETSPAGGYEDSSGKKVTMVAWTLNDALIITAVSDNSIRLWNSVSGDPRGSLRGHSNEIFVMEPHPRCCSILLSAAHDGKILLWNLETHECIMEFNNNNNASVPSEESAALYDAKWTPDGTGVVATDSLGHLLILGHGSSESFAGLPKELFFHTDYRPLLRDSFHNVLDEQMQVPPHLLPSPFLVDSEGFPYPPHVQRLVRGREHLSNSEALIPRGPEPSFNINNSFQVPNEEEPRQEQNLLQAAQAQARAAVQDRVPEESTEEAGEERVTNPRYVYKESDPAYKYTLLRTLQTIREFSAYESQLFHADRKKYLLDHDYHLSLPSSNNSSSRKSKTSSQAREASLEKDEEDSEEEKNNSDVSLDEGDFSSMEEDSSFSEEEASCNDHSDWGSDAAEKSSPRLTLQPKKRNSKKGARNAAAKCREQMLLSAPGGDLADAYIPSSWLSESIPRKTPYFPQLGDVLMYFKRGHEKYLDLVRDRKTYIINVKEQTWIKKKLSESVMAKIIGIQFEIKPPRLAVLKFQILNQSTGNPSGETFTLKYHDMNDVVDFLVLHQAYSGSTHEWKVEDRIRCQIDDCWWKGTVKAIGPETSTSGATSDESKFLSILCHWDNGEKEFLSPWDLEELTEETESIPDGTSVTSEQLKSCLYQPTDEEWNNVGREVETKRISEALETIMGLSKAEPFNYPVDQSAYPEYFYSVEYPMDLSLIKARVDNNFYRRIASIEYDLKYIYENAEAFNVPKSEIVKSSKVIMMLAVQIINDPEKSKDDVSELYHMLVQDFVWSSSEEEEELNEELKSRLQRVQNENLNPKKWKQDCSNLLKKVFSLPFSAPFQEPVSEIEFPDYHRFIHTPIDLSSIKESLHIGNYTSPMGFQKDIQLLISNSREFNTNPKSKILLMTNQLDDWITPQINELIGDWKKTNRRISRKRMKKERPSEASPPLPAGGGSKGKGVGKGKSNTLARKAAKAASAETSVQRSGHLSSSTSGNEEESSCSSKEESHDDESFVPLEASSSRRRTQPTPPQDIAPSSLRLRNKQNISPEDESDSSSSEEDQILSPEGPKPQRSAKPKTRLPSGHSSSSEEEEDGGSVGALQNEESVELPSGSLQKSTIVTQVSRSGRVVRKSAWKDYTYSDGEDESDDEAPLARKGKRSSNNNTDSSRASRRPARKVATQVPMDPSDEEEDISSKHRPSALNRKKKKQSEESESEFSESSTEESEAQGLSEVEEAPPPPAQAKLPESPHPKVDRRGSKRKSVRPAKYREEEENDELAEEEEEPIRLSQRNGRSRRPQKTVSSQEDDSDEVHYNQRLKRKSRLSHSPNSSEQENRRPPRRAAASVKRKLKEQSSSNSSDSSSYSDNDVSSDDHSSSRRRKKPRFIK